MAKDIKTYKRSEDRPIEMTEQHKKDVRAFEVTSNIIKYTLIAVVLLSLLFGMLALVRVDVKSEQLDTIAANKDKFANISAYDTIGAWFAKSSYDYEDRGIHKGYQYPNTFDYIVDKVPALNAAIGIGSMGASQIFTAITKDQDAQLNAAYIAMLTLVVITLIWLVAMGVIFALTFVKKMMPSQTIINTSIIIHFVLTFILWAITLALSANSTAEMIFSTGVGMWLNLLLSVVLTTMVIFNIIYQAKVKAHEKAARL